MSEAVLDRLERVRIVPVVVIDDAAGAGDLAEALAAGGIRCAEITLRTQAGLAALEAAATVPDFTVGAGTVLTADQVDRCADAGAQFIVSPGFDEDVVNRARERGLVALPGIATATELQRALRAGLEAVKFFPADRLGGLPGIASLAAPFPTVRFMPSGGVSAANAAEYLAHPAVFAVGGSWMVPRAAVAAGDFAAIERLSAEAMALVAR
ncbi:MAG: bifunctional 4-hydroxy-2-oxoglutarate aldolase/2-dehydro-3-deoxy-phosphogluconate aldolase [Rhodoglobus sp.]